jgi:predicted Zn-dependent protease with MMP-like domain
MRVSMQEFEELVQKAIESIPKQFQPYLVNTMFIVEESSPQGLMGLYHGAGALYAGEGMPEQITLYKRSHERAATTMSDLIEEIRRTIVHEIGHHFGMEEDELPY